MEYAIEIRNVTKKFAETLAVDDVTVTFEAGKIHGIIGRNGSGKTVLFKCICGLLPVTQGSITVLGEKMGDGKRVPKRLGAIIETPGFLPNYTGYQNLRYLMELSGKADKARIREAIRRVGLDPDSRKHVGKYSMGMRQRLGLAQAIMDDPALLILDEPMNGLDKSGVEEMRRLFLELKEQGKTILMASHNPEDTRILCDTLHEMDAGKMTTIYENPPSC
ncbi:MAG TPA: ATP-binding cassette domain-containing protein [Candidatus Faecousia intestinigallinarum]|nr:ATP-binding cassette domain-containing protein [Candidatus Faecousia intestinigallinarum]